MKMMKRGQVQGILTMGIIATVLAITILIAYKIVTEVNDNFEGNDAISDQGKESLSSFRGSFATIFDSIYIFSLVLLAIILIASAFAIDTHPLFFVISVVLFLAVLFVNAVLANLLDDIGNTTALAALYADFTMMQFAATHWIAILTVIGFTSMMALYGKKVIT